jgi:1,4-dihydroxy-6-naphthoate synthase
MKKAIKIAYTPDPDDAFHYYALESDILAAPEGFAFDFAHGHIHDLNEACREQCYDVSAISSVFYPEIEKDYVILGSGASVGRGYGPVLGCRDESSFEDLRGKRVAIPGDTTTGYFLLRYFYDDFETVAMPFNRVADAILDGSVDAGVLIHEELINYAEQPLRKLCCLGKRWYEHVGLPLPVGLNVARRALGSETIRNIETLIHRSMGYALDHPTEAMNFARNFGRGPASKVRDEFVAKFANDDTLLMPQDVREGLRTLFEKALERGFIDHPPLLDIVDPLPGAPATEETAATADPGSEYQRQTG